MISHKEAAPSKAQQGMKQPVIRPSAQHRSRDKDAGLGPAQSMPSSHKHATRLRVEMLKLPFPSLSSFRVGGQLLVDFNDLPKWHQENHFVLRAYRPESNSAQACVASWLYLHNETVNIYSHLIPAICYMFGLVMFHRFLWIKYPESTFNDHFMFTFFLLTTIACFSLSTAYHTLMNHSVFVSNLCLRLDFMGIMFQVLGNFVSAIYVGFYCEPALRWLYWSMILSLGTAATVALVSPRFQGPVWRTFRVTIVTATSLSGIFPLVHGIVTFGFREMLHKLGMAYYLWEGLLYLIGVLFYAFRIPESIYPGKFDVFGSSHQIFHILVVMATAVHFIGVLTAFDHVYQHRTCGIA